MGITAMAMIDEEIMRMKNRMNELTNRIIPDLENKTTSLYSQIMSLREDSPDRSRLKDEYTPMARELSMRSDEVISLRQQIENLEVQKTMR